MNQPPINQPAVSAILVSRPGIMRQSLQTALAMYTWITVVGVCGDGLTALSQVIHHRPHLVIIDSNLLDEEVKALLTAIKTTQPPTRCLVLLQSSQWEASTLAAGADAVIMRDCWAQHSQVVLAQLAQ
jgi:DNA-binding NarL/FixJ family response regulator